MMTGPSKVENGILLRTGLEIMEQSGNPLEKLPSNGRSMKYKMPTGETVRARTCNDHILVVVAASPETDSRLNIEGTDWLLIVMPEEERTPGPVAAFLVPTKVAIAEVRRNHEKWLATNPQTRGNNTTRNLWFAASGPKKANNYFQKWAKFRLEGQVSTLDFAGSANEDQAHGGNIKAAVEAARERLANLAGVPPQAVKISIDFAA